MAIPERVRTKMREEGLSGINKPKRTPKHPTKSHCVMASENGKYKFIRFGQQGVKGAGKNPTSAKDKARKKSYYARHDAQGFIRGLRHHEAKVRRRGGQTGQALRPLGGGGAPGYLITFFLPQYR